MNKEELEAFERLAKDLGRVRDLHDFWKYKLPRLSDELEAERQKVTDLRNALNEAELYSQAQAELAEALQRELQEALDRAAEPDSYVAGGASNRFFVRRHKWWDASVEKWVRDNAPLHGDIFRHADDPNNDPPKLIRVLYTAEEVQAVLEPKEDDQ